MDRVACKSFGFILISVLHMEFRFRFSNLFTWSVELSGFFFNVIINLQPCALLEIIINVDLHGRFSLVRSAQGVSDLPAVMFY